MNVRQLFQRLGALCGAAALALLFACTGAPTTPSTAATVAAHGERGRELEDLERRTFQFFWDTANPANGLVPDRFPSPSFASVAAVGFALSAYPIGVERGYVSRAQARERVLRTLRFLRDAPQGPGADGFAGYKGFFYHFLNMGDGLRWSHGVELSTVDTALLMAGALACADYFDGREPGEGEIRRIADEIYRRVDWAWAANAAGGVALGWTPEKGYHPMRWHGYNEAMILYLLGLGSPTFPLPDGAWREWTSTYDPAWRTEYGQTYLTFPPLFGHQFSHVWVDFRALQDDFMRGKGIDYFENSRRATYAQQAYAIANPMHWTGYGATLFGLSASDGPVGIAIPDGTGLRVFRQYAARGMGGAATYDDGTLSPAALVSSVVFAPEIVLPAVAELNRRYGRYVYSTYGFLDALDPSFDYDVPVHAGSRIPGVGWVDGDYIGIDQGSTIGMIENYRSGLLWRIMRRDPYLRRGLERAGFAGGWLGERP
jgi:hypothetical protein